MRPGLLDPRATDKGAARPSRAAKTLAPVVTKALVPGSMVLNSSALYGLMENDGVAVTAITYSDSSG